MPVERIGFTPLKGARHAAHAESTLDPHGPVGDRTTGSPEPTGDVRTVDYWGRARPSRAGEVVYGGSVTLGEASMRVRGVVPRCAVVDLDPATGVRNVPVLATLAGYRRNDGEICFGVDADVTVSGLVRVGDPVVLGRD